MAWTEFWDMHSGGGLKEKQQFIFIEAKRGEAELIFYNRFGHNPNRVTCTCCGDDYAIEEGKTLFEVTAYHRGCDYDKQRKCYVAKPSSDSWRKYNTASEFAKREDVLIIRSEDIKPEERIGTLPRQGYVWVDE
jgi:hypothetical protein